jgi:adenine-specific DNA-methyltransferase
MANDYSSLSRDELIKIINKLEARKKYGLVWEEKPEDVIVQCKKELPVLEEVKENAIEALPNAPTNLLIEGDNYHALSVLNYTHANRVDVIYIDPPYNTGAKDWKYNNNYVDVNDRYRHSKWLSMMSKRLKIAKNLLKEDGVLVCAIDENECAHLGVLLEEIFTDHEIHCITIVHNPRGIQGRNFSYTHEYAYFVFKNNLKVIGSRKIKQEDIDWSNLRNWGSESERKDARNCFYPIIVKKGKIIGFGDVLENKKHPKAQTIKKPDQYYIYPIDRQGIERKWRYARQSVGEVKHLLRAKQTKYGYEIEIGKDFGTVRTVWQDTRYDANSYGTQLVHKLVKSANFDFPKSIYNTYDCIAPILYERKNAIVLDYFAGSGTTGHALLMLNKEDGGQRKFILCTNNENKIAEAVCYPRIKSVIKGLKDIKAIPANLRYFKTSFVIKSKVSDDTRRELVKKSTEMICIKEDAYKKIADNKGFKIYSNHNFNTGILFDLGKIEEFKAKLSAAKRPVHIYVFSLTNDTFDEDFQDLDIEYKTCPIPESILEVYRRIFKDK